MTGKETVHLSEEELRRFLSSMGTPPVLSTEDPKAFEELFFDAARSLGASGHLWLSLTWEDVVETWESRRYARHSTIATDRWLQTKRAGELSLAEARKSVCEERAQELARKPSGSAKDAEVLAALQKRIDDTVKDIDAIAARVDTEIDINRALQINADLLHDFDRLRNGVNRRRYGNFMLLDKHKADLDRAARQADKVVDAEFEEVQAETEDPSKEQVQGTPLAITAAPSIVPAKSEKSNDVESQDRSQSAQ
jgi:hypothetical protein